MTHFLKMLRNATPEMFGRLNVIAARPTALNWSTLQPRIHPTANHCCSPASRRLTIGPTPSLSENGSNRSEADKLHRDEMIESICARLSPPSISNKHSPKDFQPTILEVDGPAHFYVGSNRYNAYTKLKHRILTRMGYRVLHIPYFEWKQLQGRKEREQYLIKKLGEPLTEWLDPADFEYHEMLVSALTKPESAYGEKRCENITA
eukprot:GHVN01048617.1.p2 GENE.GHVN01048617.1~~GHVN01048617.1.p2  ORF type:complete len:205 (+),score=30.44 GHVN01048617.1:714-1328(+)